MSDFEIEYNEKPKPPFAMVFATCSKPIQPEMIDPNDDWTGLNINDIGVQFARYIYFSLSGEFIDGTIDELIRLRECSDEDTDYGIDIEEYML